MRPSLPPRGAPALAPLRPPPAGRAAAGRGGRERASRIPAALPRLWHPHGGEAAGGSDTLGVRTQPAGGGRDADREKPRLAARHVRAVLRVLWAAALVWRCRCHLPARLGGAPRAARAADREGARLTGAQHR